MSDLGMEIIKNDELRHQVTDLEAALRRAINAMEAFDSVVPTPCIKQIVQEIRSALETK
jgi:hypothetical protein